MQAGERIAGRYRLDSRLGRGGMGEVWRAFDEALGRPVAVKVLLTVDAGHEALQRFRREASIGARLQHPGITVVHDVGHHDGRLFLVMELLEGTDLAHLLAASAPGGLPVAQAVDLAAQAADALAAAHARKVVHRDLKPANLFLTADGRLKICDFGIAWTAEATEGLTLTGRPFGSPPYMSPEQWRGEHVTVQSDLYALGCVLHALLTGAPPFPTGEHPWALMRRHVEDVPAPLRSLRADVPAGVESLVAELLAKDPAARPDAATTAGRLRGAGPAAYTPTVRSPGADPAAHTVPAPGGPPRPNPGAGAGQARGPRRRSLLRGGGAAALAAATGGTALALWPKKDRGSLRIVESSVLTGLTGAAYAVAFSQDSDNIAAGGGGNAVVVWDVATSKRVTRLDGSGDATYPVDTVAYSPDGKILAEAGADGNVLLRDATRLDPAAVPAGLSTPKSVRCRTVAFSPDGKTLAAGRDDANVVLWDVARRRQSGVLTGAHRDPVLSVAYNPDGTSVLSVDSGGTVIYWNVASQGPFTLFDSAVGMAAETSAVAYARKGGVFAAATGSLRLWTGTGPDQVTVLTSRAGPLYAVAFSPDGTILATGAEDGTVEVWSVDRREVVMTFAGHGGLVRSIAFSPDGKTMAAANADKTVRLWKVSPAAA
ncbi:WD40 repeat domain-containing serine/threonine protein kinase [Streptomyces sp. NBC_01198]|uniref:WD40 repeat domain-containing serine/threonine protein kinase n=1 Tax=Streptomyces sp. NBC_01198 TaxID=2903769 RepID=UPI002E164F4C|nr:serine/threonine protein kinase [Streptomyces sp. NBC_01198]